MSIATDQEYPQQQFAQATPLRGWALALSGHGEEGVTQIRLATYRATVAKSTVRWWEAELHRLKGELLLQSAVKNQESTVFTAHSAEAQACFQQALDIARRQQARSLELRAAMSLSQLWQRQGKRKEALDLLAPI